MSSEAAKLREARAAAFAAMSEDERARWLDARKEAQRARDERRAARVAKIARLTQAVVSGALLEEVAESEGASARSLRKFLARAGVDLGLRGDSARRYLVALPRSEWIALQGLAADLNVAARDVVEMIAVAALSDGARLARLTFRVMRKGNAT